MHLKEKVDNLEKKVDKLQTKMNEKFEQVDKRFEQVDKRFEQVDKRFEQVDRRLDRLEITTADLKMRMENLDDKMTKGFSDLNKKQDELLNYFLEFGNRVIKNEEELLVLAHRQREHEDRITALEEKITG